MVEPLKPSARKMREAAVRALLAARGENRVEDARQRLGGIDIAMLDEDRLRAGDLLGRIAAQARLLDQLVGNGLASTFDEGGAAALTRDATRAFALPFLAELLADRASPPKTMIRNYVRVSGDMDGVDGPTVERLLERLAREVVLMKSSARLAAVQALYQMEIGGQPLAEVRAQFESLRIGAEIDGATYREADIDLFRKILDDTLAHQAAIDQMTNRTLKETWPLAKIDSILRALFRAAGAELIGAPATPPKLVINEYVDVARAFFPEGKEPGMVNAVLDRMAREARPEAF